MPKKTEQPIIIIAPTSWGENKEEKSKWGEFIASMIILLLLTIGGFSLQNHLLHKDCIEISKTTMENDIKEIRKTAMKAHYENRIIPITPIREESIKKFLKKSKEIKEYKERMEPRTYRKYENQRELCHLLFNQ